MSGAPGDELSVERMTGRRSCGNSCGLSFGIDDLSARSFCDGDAAAGDDTVLLEVIDQAVPEIEHAGCGIAALKFARKHVRAFQVISCQL